MMYYGQKSIPERLTQAEEIITTAVVDETIRTRMATTGYNEDQYAEVQVLLDDALRLETNQQIQLGKQTAATNELKALTQTIRLKFVSDRKMARQVLRNNRSLYEELRLQIKTKVGRDALIRQMTHFYEEAVKHDALMVELAAGYNLTVELFAGRLQEIDALMQAMQVQQYQIGLVRVATRDRREAMRLLDTWMSAFIGMARQAFRGDAENLRKLRIYTQPRNRRVIQPEETEL